MAQKSNSNVPSAREPDLVPSTNDVVFKHVFGDERNKCVTAKLLSAIFNSEEIDEADITFGDPHLKREFVKDKLGVLDMYLQLKSGKKVAVEMLVGKYLNIHKRVEYYISRMTAKQLGNSNRYHLLTPVVFILLATDPVLDNNDRYHSEFAMMEKNDRYVLHDLRTLHIIELSKVPPDSRGRLAAWLKFMLAKRKEELMVLVKENPELQYACDVLVETNSTAEVRALHELALKRWRDEQDRTAYAVNEALEKAEAEKDAALKKAEAEKDAALKKAEAEKDVALEQTFKLLKQGYPVDQVEKMIRKK